MKEDSKRLLRGMTEVSEQYILEAEAFYQKKDEQNVDRENAVKEIKEKESIEKDKKIIKMQEAKNKGRTSVEHRIKRKNLQRRVEN